MGEGFQLVVQESMACGTPALVGVETVEGCPAVQPLLFVEVVEQENAASNWRARVSGLLRDVNAIRGMRAGIASAAREQWSWPAAVQAYAVIFRELRLR